MHIHREKYENENGFEQDWYKHLVVLRKRNYYTTKDTVGGDQPKKFIRAYFHGEVKRSPRKKWVGYIAKFGKKWYPLESVTEYLLNRIGEVMGMNMAKSKLVIINQQVRFLSKYFLKKDERLVHGADIYSMYLNDEGFVKEVDEKKMERKLISYQFAEEAITMTFEDHHEELLYEFTKMLIFDALIGANDRHFYNWGIIVNIKGKKPPRFAPIYDTSRGLLWNESEGKLLKVSGSKKMMSNWVDGYLENSMPKMCLDMEGEVNHFKFVEKVLEKYPKYKEICNQFKNNNALKRVILMIDKEFAPMLGVQRVEMIKMCLEKRFVRIMRLTQNNED